MSNPLTNTFQGINISTGAHLSTDAEKLNFQGGAVKALGGIINTAQDLYESNELANFNNSLKRAEQAGDVDALQKLTESVGNFSKAANVEKAFGLATNARETTYATKFLTEAQRADQATDITAFRSVMDQVKNTNLSPTTRLGLEKQIGGQYQDILGRSLLKDGISSYDAEQNALHQSNTGIANNLFSTDAKYSKYLDNINGRIVPKVIDPNNTAEVAAQKVAFDEFHTNMVRSGARPDILSGDNAVRKFREDARKQGLSPEATEKGVANLMAAARNKRSLGEEGAAAEKNAHALVDVDTASKKWQLDEKYKFAGKINEKQVNDIVADSLYKREDLIGYVNKTFQETPLSWLPFTKDDQAQIKGKLEKYLTQEVELGNGVPKRAPTPLELKNALELAKGNIGPSSKQGASESEIEKALKLTMEKSPVSLMSAKNIGFKDIEAYAKEAQAIGSRATAEKLNASNRIYGAAGLNSSIANNKGLTDAFYRLTGTNAAGTSTSPTPVVAGQSATASVSRENQNDRNARQLGIDTKPTQAQLDERAKEIAAAQTVNNATKKFTPASANPHIETMTKVAPDATRGINAIMRVESGFKPNAESPTDAHGLMQITRNTADANKYGVTLAKIAKEKGIAYDPKDREQTKQLLRNPEINIEFSKKFLDKLTQDASGGDFKTFSDNIDDDTFARVLVGYNHGPGNAWKTRVPVETADYVKKIFRELGRTPPQYDTYIPKSKSSKTHPGLKGRIQPSSD